jgi:hypothetical protein
VRAWGMMMMMMMMTCGDKGGWTGEKSARPPSFERKGECNTTTRSPKPQNRGNGETGAERTNPIKTHRTIPINLPRLLIISPLRPFLLVHLLRLVPDQPRDRRCLRPIPLSNVMTLGIELGRTDVVGGGRGLVVVQGGFGGGTVLSGDCWVV